MREGCRDPSCARGFAIQTTAFDELYGYEAASRTGREGLEPLARWLVDTPPERLAVRGQAAERYFRELGITFAVYGEDEASERIIPFDLIPRVFTHAEWTRLSAGLVQRTDAINAFIADIYGERRILAEGLIPADVVLNNPQFCVPANGVVPPHGVHAHICGIDIVRTGPDDFFVLEDNARTPSGVSYMVENREAMLRLCPELFRAFSVEPVDSYADALAAMMASVAPLGREASPTCVILTPGHFNSAFFEHSFLADSAGITLVQGPDLLVEDDVVYMRTISGRQRVDVIYRRIDDEYLDPLFFNPTSMLGVPGLIAAWAAGNVTIINAPGTGISDDKAIYSYMPEIVRFYCDAEPLLPNVETFRCREADSLAYTLDHLDELVVKLVDGSGGYGMLVGPTASRDEIDSFRRALIAEPARYIAQPTLALSTIPTGVGSQVGPRHVDFRPFVLTGADGAVVTPGGLTRVALREGSLVVNSSQGGGTKDSFVLSPPGEDGDR